MKKNITYFIISIFMLISGFTCLQAQPKDGEWKKKMMNEKIAFLTTELEITPEEAQRFWPVYNELNKEKDQAMYRMFGCYKKLSQALKDGRSGKEIEKLLDDYLEAQEEQRELDDVTADRFRKVLPVEKVAKLYVAEEKFRRQQIHKLHHGNNHQEKR